MAANGGLFHGLLHGPLFLVEGGGVGGSRPQAFPCGVGLSERGRLEI
jgi:hypothetical protein